MPKGVYERFPPKDTIVIRIEKEDAQYIRDEVINQYEYMSWSEIMKKYINKNNHKEIVK